jgi:hypothetical protein
MVNVSSWLRCHTVDRGVEARVGGAYRMKHRVRQIRVGAPFRRSGLAWVEVEIAMKRNDAYANSFMSASAFASQSVIPISRNAATAVVR